MSNNLSQKPLIILTAGGTGGHVFPAESLAEELSARGYRLALVTDSRGKDNYHEKNHITLCRRYEHQHAGQSYAESC